MWLSDTVATYHSSLHRQSVARRIHAFSANPGNSVTGKVRTRPSQKSPRTTISLQTTSHTILPTAWLLPQIATRTCFSWLDRRCNLSRATDSLRPKEILSKPAFLQTCRQTSSRREARGPLVLAFLHRYPFDTSGLARTVHCETRLFILPSRDRVQGLRITKNRAMPNFPLREVASNEKKKSEKTKSTEDQVGTP